jgi:hypothetical protein
MIVQNVSPYNPEKDSCFFLLKDQQTNPPKDFRTSLRAWSLSFTEGASCRAILAASWCSILAQNFRGSVNHNISK